MPRCPPRRVPPPRAGAALLPRGPGAVPPARGGPAGLPSPDRALCAVTRCDALRIAWGTQAIPATLSVGDYFPHVNCFHSLISKLVSFGFGRLSYSLSLDFLGCFSECSMTLFEQVSLSDLLTMTTRIPELSWATFVHISRSPSSFAFPSPPLFY